MALAGWRRGIPRASGSPGKDLNSRLECRSQLIPIKGHGGDGSQRGPRKVLLERLCAEVSSSVRASTFLITEAGGGGGGGRAGVGCFVVCLLELMAAPSLTFKASNAAFQAAPAGERGCGRKLSRLKCHVRLETRGKAGASTCLRSTPIHWYPPSCLVARMLFPRRTRL